MPRTGIMESHRAAYSVKCRPADRPIIAQRARDCCSLGVFLALANNLHNIVYLSRRGREFTAPRRANIIFIRYSRARARAVRSAENDANYLRDFYPSLR